jgi:hypothetical protein
VFSFTFNYVRAAIASLGGPTKAASLLNCCNATIHNWIKKSNVPDIDKAKALAKLSKTDLAQIWRAK